MNRAVETFAALTLGAAAVTAGAADRPSTTVVLVHGAFVDGSGWSGVYKSLRKDGYKVAVVQSPNTSLADDVAATRRAIAAAEGNVVLVGHSYGGVIITEAGTDPKVTALVYVAAFAPEVGESVSTLNANPPPGAPVPPILPPVAGLLTLDKARFHASFAADLPADLAQFMADSQQPWAAQALEGKITAPAWKVKPSWYVVAKDDLMIPASAQRSMAARARAKVSETAGSHAFFVVNPGPVVALIEEAAAAKATATAAR